MHRSYILQLIVTNATCKSNNKYLWSCNNSKQIDHSDLPPLSHNGRAITDSKNMVNTLTDHFSYVFIDKDINTIPTLNNNLYSNIQLFEIYILDVYHHLASLQSHKATGPDNIQYLL